MRSLFLTTLLILAAGCAGPSTSGGAVPYPLDDCIVTDNALGSMGDPVRIVHEGHEVMFCCAPCEEEFYENPTKYMAKIR